MKQRFFISQVATGIFVVDFSIFSFFILDFWGRGEGVMLLFFRVKMVEMIGLDSCEKWLRVRVRVRLVKSD